MTFKVPKKEIPKPMPKLFAPIYRKKRHGTGLVVTVWAFLYACLYVYCTAICKALDWFGKKLVDLIDHSDFFAGCVTTAAVISIWELLTR